MPKLRAPNTPSKVPRVRKLSISSNEHGCNNESWQISVHSWVKVSVSSTRCYSLKSPLDALYTVSSNDGFGNKNTQKFFRNHLCCYLHICRPVTSITDAKDFSFLLYPYNVIFRHRYLDAIECKVHHNYTNFKMWKKVLESRKCGNQTRVQFLLLLNDQLGNNLRQTVFNPISATLRHL
jgi:hypothetical protein